MANFTKQVPFRAYQFVPEAVAGIDPYDLEDIIEKELGEVEICSADVIDGELTLVFRAYGLKDYVQLKPGEWIVTPEMIVRTNAEFQEFATPAP